MSFIRRVLPAARPLFASPSVVRGVSTQVPPPPASEPTPLDSISSLLHPSSSSSSSPAGPTFSELSAAAAAPPAASAPAPLLAPGYHALSLPPSSDPLLAYLTNLIMQSGKKARAQKYLSLTLREIQLLTSATRDPVPLLRDALRTAAPAMRLRSSKQHNKTVHTPQALSEKQGVRQAWVWIVAQSDRRNERYFWQRLAREILAVAEGSSEVLKKKEEAHKLGMMNRANLVVRRR